MNSKAIPPVPFSAVTLLAMLAALAAIFLYAPTEAVQGDVQRILYFHVGLAAAAYISFLVTAGASIAVLAGRGSQGDRLARSAATVGVVFTTLVLVTGSIWGRAVWGVWWTWDAKLTTTLVLWFVQTGYLLLRGWIDYPLRRARLAAFAGILGAVVVPINYMSAYWWRTLHPEPTVIAPDSPGLPPAMAHTLIAAVVALLLVWGWMLWWQLAIERASDRLEELAYLD